MKNETPVVVMARLRSEAYRFRGCAMRAYLAKNWEMAMFYHFAMLDAWNRSNDLVEDFDEMNGQTLTRVSFYV
jgi:hypothetical protein